MNRDEATARLTLRFAEDKEKTYLASQYYKLPLQVLPPHYQDDDGTAFVYLLNPSGGIMQGDRLLTEIKLEERASVVVSTPSAAKCYKMEDSSAIVENTFDVEKNAILEYIPEHVVPFNGTDTVQSNLFLLDREAVLLAVDTVTSGRKARGESFGYTRFCSKTAIYVEGRLILQDCMDIKPREEKLYAKGVLEGNDIISGMYLYKQGAAYEIKKYVASNMRSYGNTRVGVSAVSSDLVVIRMLGDNIIDYKDTIADLWNRCRLAMLGKKAVRLRKY